MKELEQFLRVTNVEDHYERQHHWRTEDEAPIPFELGVYTKSLSSTAPWWICDETMPNYRLIEIIYDDEQLDFLKQEQYFHPIIALMESNLKYDEIYYLVDAITDKMLIENCCLDDIWHVNDYTNDICVFMRDRK